MSFRIFMLGASFSSIAVIAVAACGGGGSSGGQSDSGVITVGGSGPVVDNVTVEGSASAQIRQGSGEVPTNQVSTIHVTGRFLDQPAGVSIGDIPGTITASSDESLTFTVRVRHGASLGVQPVKISALHGASTYPQGVTITPITSAPTGADVPGSAGANAPAGSDESPFRSLAKALSVASQGDTILLKNGTYNQANGDIFVTTVDRGATLPINVPAGVTIKGETTAGVMLVGSQTSDSCEKNGIAQVALVLGGDAHLDSMSISQFCEGVYTTAGVATMNNVAMQNIQQGCGIDIGGTSSVTIDNLNIGASNAVGACLGGSGSLTMSNSRIIGANRGAIWCYSEAGSINLSVSSTAIHDDGGGRPMAADFPAAIEVYAGNNSSFTLANGVSFAGQTNDLELRGPSTGSPHASIASSYFSDQVTIDGQWAVKARASAFQGPQTFLLISGGTLLDFAKGDDAVANTFSVSTYGIDDVRVASNAPSVPLILTGSTFFGAGSAPAKGCSAPTGNTNAALNIEHPGTCSPTGNVGNVAIY